uniref:Uncharacterized protein n=1 Tax=Rhizophora mucronata TaxID=61149 RepID=A0A2P2QBF3_RHIMU
MAQEKMRSTWNQLTLCCV